MSSFAGHYRDLMRQARRHARRADEAEDLLQTVLLSAVQAGRADLAQAANRRWISGALRKRAAFDARTALRRRRREAGWQAEPQCEAGAETEPDIAQLSPALRRVVLLALSGHNRAEIASLLRLTDATLRQRISAIRRQLGPQAMPMQQGPRGTLAFGRLRQAIRPALAKTQGALGSHDPDGHIFILSSRNPATRQLTGRACKPEE